MEGVLERLRGGLIVSCQAKTGSAMDHPAVIGALARTAQDNGAAAVRIQGVPNLRAVMERVTVPLVGLIKREYPGFEPYISPTGREIEEILETGVRIIAFDATARPHPEGATTADLVAAIKAGGALAMADCATEQEGWAAAESGADIVASTLCGYTKETAGLALPATNLIRAWKDLDAFVICEGGVHTPAQARDALEAGAQAVVVGTAITGTDWLVKQFAAALRT